MVARSGRVDPERAMPRTLAALFTLAVLAMTAAGAAARDVTVPVVHRGQTARISARVSGTPPCLASVQYADGLTQNTGIKHAILGKVSWTIRIPNNAAIGTAHWNVRCGPSAKSTGTWRVARSTASGGGPALPVVMVQGNGFSQRPDKFGGTSKVSFGIFLKDTSPTRDAENVYLLINFVDATGELLGTMTKSIPLVGADQVFAYGDEMSLRTQALVTKLEVTVKVGDGSPAAAHPQPHFANVRIVPDSHDPSWVSEVDGEIANDTAQATMTSAQLSIVVLDASGGIVGGGKANVNSPLPSGSRMVFLGQSGFGDIPTNKAASVVISAQPQYQTN